MSIPHYGLISAAHDRFFAFAESDEYEIIKHVQLLFSKFDLFYIVDLTKVKTRDISTLDSPVLYTLNGAKRLHVEPDVDTYTLPNLFLTTATSPTEHQLSLHEKINLLFGLSKSLIKTYHLLSNIIVKEMKQEIDGFRVTKEFLWDIVGQDDSLDALIDRDQREAEIRRRVLDDEKRRIMTLLVDIDFDKTVNEIKKDLLERLGNADPRGAEMHKLRYVMVKACQ